MEKIPEIVFGSSDKKESAMISRLVKQGKLRKISPRIYTSNFIDTESSIIKRNIFFILGNLYPGSLLSFRSAFEFRPAVDGSIFLTYKYSKNISLGDLKIRFIKGYPPVEGDNKVFGDLYVSQKARAFLENLSTSRKSDSVKRNLDVNKLEAELEKIIVVNGENEVNKLRDKARYISDKLNYQKEFKKLDKIIGALLSSQPSKILKSPVARARAFGEPYDSKKLELFENLFRFLNANEYSFISDKNITDNSFRNFAFFESYFSNYIEGTILEIDDAKNVIRTGVPLPAKENDSHDVLGTYLVVSEKENISITPETADEFIELLKHRHRIILSSRTEKSPGEFKNINNRAGSTEFVDYTLVSGTLKKGFEFYKLLSNPYAKTLYMHIIVSEVHPFLDGNGRIARIMMNAELVKSGQAKILIPNVYRDDYLLSLKQVTRNSNFDLYLKMMNYIRDFSSLIFGEDLEELQLYLENSNAFLEPDEGRLKIIEKK